VTLAQHSLQQCSIVTDDNMSLSVTGAFWLTLVLHIALFVLAVSCISGTACMHPCMELTRYGSDTGVVCLSIWFTCSAHLKLLDQHTVRLNSTMPLRRAILQIWPQACMRALWPSATPYERSVAAPLQVLLTPAWQHTPAQLHFLRMLCAASSNVLAATAFAMLHVTCALDWPHTTVGVCTAHGWRVSDACNMGMTDSAMCCVVAVLHGSSSAAAAAAGAHSWCAEMGMQCQRCQPTCLLFLQTWLRQSAAMPHHASFCAHRGVAGAAACWCWCVRCLVQ
jgi:hypothetical protein